MLATAVRLMGHLHERWSRDGLTAEQAITCVLGRGGLLRITGRGRTDVALTLLERLADVTGMMVERCGDDVRITWPKFSEFQGLPTRKPPDETPKPTLSETDPDPVPAPDTTTEIISSSGNGKPPSGDDDDPLEPNELAEGWNDYCAKPYGLPSVQLPLSGKRVDKAKARIREHPSDDWWGSVFRAIGASPFLTGKTKTKWKANFDWLLANDTNAIKVLEGQYRT